MLLLVLVILLMGINKYMNILADLTISNGIGGSIGLLLLILCNIGGAVIWREIGSFRLFL